VDNTPPAVEKLGWSTSGARADIQFIATDGASGVERAQYSVDGGEWLMLAPKAGITGGNQETYEFSVHGLKTGEHALAVRVYDRFENVGSGKLVVTVKP
jgi:hypothetical protein